MKIFLLFSLIAISFGYELNKTYAGDTFLDGFYFFHQKDPNHGTVQYVDAEIARILGLTTVVNGKVKISVDSTNAYPDDGRPSVRIHSHDRYNDGLFIFDIDHMPVGPGTWPAFWFCGDSWPANGEIDVLEGIYGKTENNQALHTTDNCTMPLDASIFKGHWTKGPQGKITNDCYVNAPGQGGSGCSITSENGLFGVPFNAAGGGVFAFEWIRESSMKIWIFKRANIPADITQGTPNPDNWGKPEAYYTIGPLCPANHFNDHEIIINCNLCGDWAGGAYPGGWDACNQIVRNNPAAFNETYWLINSLKYYSL
jgi:hypothetical protein